MLFALKVAEFQSMNVVRPQDTYKKERFYRRKNYAKCTTELLPRALDAPATGTHPNANLLRTVRHEQVKVSSALCCFPTIKSIFITEMRPTGTYATATSFFTENEVEEKQV